MRQLAFLAWLAAPCLALRAGEAPARVAVTIPPKRTREAVAKSAADFVRESPAYPRSAERAVPVPVALAEFGEDAVLRRALAFLLEREVPRLLKQKVTRGAPPPPASLDEEEAAALGRLVPGEALVLPLRLDAPAPAAAAAPPPPRPPRAARAPGAIDAFATAPTEVRLESRPGRHGHG